MPLKFRNALSAKPYDLSLILEPAQAKERTDCHKCPPRRPPKMRSRLIYTSMWKWLKMVIQAWVAQWYSAYLTCMRPLVPFPAPSKQTIMILLHEIFTKIGIRLATGKKSKI